MALFPWSCLLVTCFLYKRNENLSSTRQQTRTFALSTTNRNTAASTPIPPPPPLSLPVWSLATPSLLNQDDDDDVDDESTMQTTTSTTRSTSMNIVTFASAVSVAAPKYWMISLYYDTLTKDSFCAGARQGVLQLLTPAHASLVPILGKHSGYDGSYSKRNACRAAGMAWIDNGHDEFLSSPQQLGQKNDDDETIQPLALLPKCASYLHVRLRSTVDAGDHLVCVCELMGTGVWDEEKQTIVKQQQSGDKPVAPMDHQNVLYTGLLRREGII